ncbi:S8 family serine peptidase [bacterium]|nr:S8 family serine peptidase [bacterium]
MINPESLSSDASTGGEVTNNISPRLLIDELGTPGVDYDDTAVYVGYRRDAELPFDADSAGDQLPPTRRAAAQANALMRHEPKFEKFSDVIAGAFDLDIETQVYNDYNLFASFAVPEGTNHLDLAREIYAQFPDLIEYVTFQPLYRCSYQPNDPDYLLSGNSTGPQWALIRMDCEAAWEYTHTEPGVLIAIIDDAFNLSHEELRNTILDPQVEFSSYQLDITMGDNDVTPDNNELSHGTGCAGVAAAESDNDRTITGTGMGCRIVPIKCNSKTEPGYLSNTTEGLELAIDLAEAGYNIRVISCSWGSLRYKTEAIFQPQYNACQRAFDNGILVVAAAGNNAEELFENPETGLEDVPYDPDVFSHYPSDYDTVLCVGAVHSNLNRASYSNWGPQVDVAGGTDLKSCDLPGTSDYRTFTGTSCATPAVAGAAALLFILHPEYLPGDVMDLLAETGDSTSGFSPEVPFVNIGQAINFAPPPSPTIGGLQLPAGNVLSKLLEKDTLQASISNPNAEVAAIRYDVVTQGTSETLLSITIDVNAPAFSFSHSFDFKELDNGLAALRATPLSDNGREGAPLEEDIVIYALPGDANLDGKVNVDDFSLIRSKMGREQGSEDYDVFCDTDLDGVIRENDITAVGYFSTGSYPVAPRIESAVFNSGSQKLTVQVSDANPSDTLTVSVTEPYGLLADETSKQASAPDPRVAEFTWSTVHNGPLTGITDVTTITVTDNTGLFSQTTARLTMPGISLAYNTLYAIPLQTTAEINEPVTILVASGAPSESFNAMNGVALTVESNATYVPDSFNVGDVGGERWEPDGFWLAMPDCELFGPDDFSISPTALDNGRVFFNGLSIFPVDQTAVAGFSGVLFNLQLVFSETGSYHLGFLQQHLLGVKYTYFTNTLGQECFWNDIDNRHDGIPYSIDVSMPGNQSPNAVLSATPSSGCRPLMVMLDASASVDPDGNDDSISYLWDLDSDGAYDYDSGTDSVYNAEYATIGTYTSTVKITDEGGATDTAQVTVDILPAGDVDWAHTWGTAQGNEEAVYPGLDGNNNHYIIGWGHPSGLVISYDNAGVYRWARRYSSPTGESWVKDGWVNADGTSYLCGFHCSTSGDRDQDFIVAKFNPDGSLAADWVGGGAEDDGCYGMAVDSSGNVYLFGYTDSFGVGQQDYLLVKLDSSCNLIWARTWGTTSRDWNGGGIHINPDGAVYLVGETDHNDSYFDGVLVHFPASGNPSGVWSYQWSTAAADSFAAISAGADGKLIIAGSCTVTPADVRDLIAIKVSTNPDQGATALIWDTMVGGADSDSMADVIVNGEGQVYLLGFFGVPNSNSYLTLARLTSDGNLLMSKQWSGPLANWSHGGFNTTAAGELLFTGSGQNSTGDLINGSFVQHSVSGAWDSLEGEVTTPAIVGGSLGGSVVPVTGVHDSGGGGGEDLLIIKFDPEA